MGRGLSELQRAILARGLWNGERERAAGIPVGDGEHCCRAHVYGCEVAADYFGWPLPPGFYDFELDGDGRVDRVRWYNACRRPDGTTADRAGRVHAAICRAFHRPAAWGTTTPAPTRAGAASGSTIAGSRWSGSYRLI
jgi:hypothetical protein